MEHKYNVIWRRKIKYLGKNLLQLNFFQSKFHTNSPIRSQQLTT